MRFNAEGGLFWSLFHSDRSSALSKSPITYLCLILSGSSSVFLLVLMLDTISTKITTTVMANVYGAFCARSCPTSYVLTHFVLTTALFCPPHREGTGSVCSDC